MAAKVAVFFCFLPVSLLLPLTAFADPDPSCTSTSNESLCTLCLNDTGNVTPPFKNNLRNLLQSLPTNTSLTGFYDGSLGSDPSSEVYVQALCRGDVGSSDCKDCVEKASREILKECQTMEAIIWYQLCQVHYSHLMFFSSMVYTGKYPPYNNEKQRVNNEHKFYLVLEDLFDKLSNQAANDSSRQMFAVGRAKVSHTKVYGLVECTRDISANDCATCLQDALGDLKGCCFSHDGGMVLSRNCDVRFETFRFYNLSAVDEISSSRARSIFLKAIVAAVVSAVLLIVLTVLCIFRGKTRKKEHNDEDRGESTLISALAIPQGVGITEEGELVFADELPFMDLNTIRAATDDFSDSNKLGQGGFGIVYAGVLCDGTKIAVKRLSRRSSQGIEEFKNEIILIAKLQHRNLVRLLGCTIEGEEKILVYEYMPNKSLELFIFDEEMRARLNWEMRYSIIHGIARGLLYLHEDSRLRIIHRDLKPSNVLLDHEMEPKISDFGMARIFCDNQNAGSTKRVVGTYGYMAPEYAMEGLFSIKSDVFSFGVILLEIISGKKNSGFHLTKHAQTLLAYAWRLWNEAKELEFVDSLLPEPYPATEVIRFMHIGLLCVQEDPANRPTMSYVVSWLSSEATALPEPERPAISVERHEFSVNYDQLSSTTSSINEFSVSSIIAR
ncbi:hypothetical protein Ancab_004977 [Ancistrocladus abbreviatus]